jgi:L-histidine Nalpha-methyltransferase
MKASRPARMGSYAIDVAHPPRLRALGADERLRIDVSRAGPRLRTLARDVRVGLQAPQKWLPPKYFYDDRGAQLFDRICDLPEYYLTRTEQALLDAVVPDIVALTAPADLVELGSGAARKTRILLDAFSRAGCALRYVPIDVSEGMLRQAAHTLLRDYPQLRVHGIVADYEDELACLPASRRRLVIFLGSTIGNFTPAATARFLAGVHRHLASGDHFLLGVDLVKPVEVLEAAYNDGAGVTADFNRNVLRVINRELDATFDPEGFEHVAFFNAQKSQIEMHLRPRSAHAVTIRRLRLTVPFVAGETIHTEISRKFTVTAARAMLTTAGFELLRWYTPEDQAFGLALARVP